MKKAVAHHSTYIQGFILDIAAPPPPESKGGHHRPFIQGAGRRLP
jgi:hypothetical protein